MLAPTKSFLTVCISKKRGRGLRYIRWLRPRFLLMFRLYGRAVLTPAEHDFGGEGAILIGKGTGAAVFLCNMGDGLDADTVFPPL